jgi:hypothetical protein
LQLCHLVRSETAYLVVRQLQWERVKVLDSPELGGLPKALLDASRCQERKMAMGEMIISRVVRVASKRYPISLLPNAGVHSCLTSLRTLMYIPLFRYTRKISNADVWRIHCADRPNDLNSHGSPVVICLDSPTRCREKDEVRTHGAIFSPREAVKVPSSILTTCTGVPL